MELGKADYEKLIAESGLFSLKRESGSVAYRRESYKMVEYLYCYITVGNEGRYEPYGCEITELAIRCIKNYDGAKGDFLHYFNAAWKAEFGHICGEQALDERLHGIKISEDKKRFLKHYLRYERSAGSYPTDREKYEAIAGQMGCSLEDVQQAEELLGIRIVGGSVENGTEGNRILDQISDGNLVEELALPQEREKEMLDAIEGTFQTLQPRQKSILSELITIRIAEEIQQQEIDVSGYLFMNQEILQNHANGLPLPTQREIAAKYQRNEASISRTLREFRKRVYHALE